MLKQSKINSRVLDLSGQSYGLLKVIKFVGIGKDHYAKWLCECACGRSSIIRGISLKRGDTKSCGCKWHPKGKESKLWKGYGDISGLVWRNIKQSAKDRKIKFDLDIVYCWNLFIKQDRKCALSGVLLKFSDKKDNYSDTTASLDRINSLDGYTKNNIQWVHKTVNQIKWELSNEELKYWCKLISKKV
jgi:hypothetical protein